MTQSLRIADWRVDVTFATDRTADAGLPPQFTPFLGGEDCELLLSLVVDDTLRPVARERRRLVRTFHDGNGDIRVDLISGGGYQFVIRDTDGSDTALLIADTTFSHCRCALAGTRSQRLHGLTSAILIAFADAGCQHGTMLMHASVVVHRGRGYAFVAKSGTGKSTHAANWLRTIPDTELLNDDTPAVRLRADGTLTVCGSPWSGKTPCYRQRSVPLAAISLIVRDTTNHVEPLPPVTAFGTLLASCSTMKWDSAIYSAFCDTAAAIVSRLPFYSIHCNTEPQAAIVSHEAICKS